MPSILTFARPAEEPRAVAVGSSPRPRWPRRPSRRRLRSEPPTERPSDPSTPPRPTSVGHRCAAAGGCDHPVPPGRAGEVLLNLTVSAHGVSWADRGNESAVVSAYVDGHYATDIVITSVGRVPASSPSAHCGPAYTRCSCTTPLGRSPSNAGVARLQDIGFTTVRPSDPAYAAATYAPVLYGRNIAASAADSRTTARTPRSSPGTRCCRRRRRATR